MPLTTFKRVHTANRGYSTYRAEGFPGVILLAKPAFNGSHPESIEVADVPEPVVSARAARAKMTPEERKAAAAERRARNASMTPAQKLEAQEQRLAKQAANLAAKKAALEASGAAA